MRCTSLRIPPTQLHHSLRGWQERTGLLQNLGKEDEYVVAIVEISAFVTASTHRTLHWDGLRHMRGYTVRVASDGS